MATQSRGRTLFLAALALFVLVAAGFAYASYHDRLWNTGPVNALFHAADKPDTENSVGVTSEVRAMFPDGSAIADVEAALTSEGFVCEAASDDTACRRRPFTPFCTETWFVRYAEVTPETLNVTHASKQLRCG